jgi:hypothetical protein
MLDKKLCTICRYKYVVREMKSHGYSTEYVIKQWSVIGKQTKRMIDIGKAFCFDEQSKLWYESKIDSVPPYWCHYKEEQDKYAQSISL